MNPEHFFLLRFQPSYTFENTLAEQHMYPRILLTLACSLAMAAVNPGFAADNSWSDVRYLPSPELPTTPVQVDISGNWAIAAAELDSPPACVVSCYERTPTGWVLRGFTFIPRPASIRLRGVSIHGDAAAIVGSDRVWMLRRKDDSWDVEQTLFVPLGGPGDDILHAELFSNNEVVIGSLNTLVDNALGYAFVFSRGETDGIWSEKRRIPNPQGMEPNQFGRRVASDGQHIVVSAPELDDEFQNQGGLFVFSSDDLKPRPPALALRPNPRADDRFGAITVSVFGNRLATGSFSRDLEDENFVEVFALQNGKCAHTVTLGANDFAEVDGDHFLFGRTVSVVDGGVMIGWFDAAAAGTMPVLRPGAIHFARFNDDKVVEHRTWISNHHAVGSAMGYFIASDGERVIAAGLDISSNFRPVVISRDPECFRDLRADANGDGIVNFEDLNLVLSQFGQTGENLQGDLISNGVVDFFDLNVVLVLFGSPCIPPN